MKIYAIGDTHLSLDPRIEKPMDIFGSRWVNHHIKLKENWESVITDDDYVIIAGDISWGLRLDEAMADFDWIHNLPGKKIITKGNHDLWWASIGKLNKLYDDVTFLQNRAFMADEKTAICATRGWICPGTEGFTEHDQKIYDRECLRLQLALDEAKKLNAETIIGVLHYPPTNDKFQPSGFTDLMSEYGVKKCVYGHLHGKDAFKNGFKGVLNGVNYRLVSLDYLDAMPELIYEKEQGE